MRRVSRRRSGIRTVEVRTGLAAALVVSLAFAASGCNYSLRQGSFPAHIQTIAVLPFDNQTTRLELGQELYESMLQNLPRQLGIQTAAPEEADAVVSGTITGYSLSAPNYRPADQGDRTEVLQRQVTVTLSVEILDRVNNVILFQDGSVRAEGRYLEASETEQVAQQEALELLVQRIVDGAQSNW